MYGIQKDMGKREADRQERKKYVLNEKFQNKKWVERANKQIDTKSMKRKKIKKKSYISKKVRGKYKSTVLEDMNSEQRLKVLRHCKRF